MEKKVLTHKKCKKQSKEIQKQYILKRKDINFRSSVQEMGAKSAIDKLTTRKCHTWGKEDVMKFQDLSQYASRQSNSWGDSNTINLTLNTQICLSLGNEHTMVSQYQSTYFSP